MNYIFLILDEPTNHLDIDSRAALIEAINDYEGAIILISHDRYLIDACADRLWLVDQGTVRAFDGDMDDYKALVLSRAGGGTGGRRGNKPETSSAKAAADAARAAPGKAPARSAQRVKSQIGALEDKIKTLSDLIARVDAALVDPNAYSRDPNKSQLLSKQRAELQRALDAAEDEWLNLTAAMEAAAE